MSIPYNLGMDVTGWTNKEIIQVLIAQNRISQKELIKLLENSTNEKIPQSTFANRLWRDSLRLRELQNICDVLDYKIILEPKNQ